MAAMPENALSVNAFKKIIDKYGARIKYIRTPYATIVTNTKLANRPTIDTSNIVTYDIDGYGLLETRCFDSMTRREYTKLIRIGDVVEFVIADNAKDKLDMV